MKSKGKKTRHKKTNSQKHNKPKGKLLEQIVAALYETPGAKIQTNVDYPTKDGKSTREIDILWTTNVAGLKVEYAFQCKNEIAPIGVGKLSQFFGDLDDIGIPAKYGIFVSVNGFTEDALRYAETKGIKTLVLKGLTTDRLKSEVSGAIQHNIYLIPRVNEMSVLNEAPIAEHEYQFGIFTDENQHFAGTILDLIFNKWCSGEISEELGDHAVTLSVPKNWFQFYKGKPVPPMKVSAKVSVLAVVISIDGIAENHTLLDAGTKKIEKFNTHVNFRGFKKGDEIPLTVISSEQELNDFVEKSKAVRLTIKSKLPRIISNKSYYPISKAVVEKIFSHKQKENLDFHNISQEKLDEILTDVEKNDLFREGIYNFAGKLVSVIVFDSDGDLIDLNLLADKGDFEKILTLGDKYGENPSFSFRLLLALANEQKGSQFFNKAKEATVNQTNLLKQGLRHIQIAHELNPESISVLELKGEILFTLGDHVDALKTVDFILSKERKNINAHRYRIEILIKLEKWDLASNEIKITEKLVKSSNDAENTMASIKVFQAAIFHGQKKYEQAWKNILEIWKKYPDESARNFSRMNFVIDIVHKVLTIESRWLHIEILYFQAIDFLKFHEYETATRLANDAAFLLDDIKLLDQVDGEYVATGIADHSFIEENLKRFVKVLRGINNDGFAEQQINRIREWFVRTYNEEPDFLEG
ncbi:MAG TPA: restriction endonuclease [Pyrinomonadaceae bacterium]|jgi:tetratricopeptide (TPR) repeat protein